MKHGRTDKTQKAAVALLRRAGFSVFITSDVGCGFPDLVVGKNGITLLLEMKSKGERKRKSQVAFADEWQGAPVLFAWSAEEALEKCLLAIGIDTKHDAL